MNTSFYEAQTHQMSILNLTMTEKAEMKKKLSKVSKTEPKPSSSCALPNDIVHDTPQTTVSVVLDQLS